MSVYYPPSHDNDLEEHWWRTTDFLATVDQAGIMLNPNIFQFAAGEVDFAEFCITNDDYQAISN